MNIAIVCPTRGRQESAVEFLESWRRAGCEHSTVIFGADCDDEASHKVLLSKEVRVIEMPTLSGYPFAINTLAHWAEGARYDVIGLFGDDVRFRTPGWEQKVIEAFEAGAHVVYGDDLYENRPTHPFVSARLVRAIGLVCPPCCFHYCMDDFIGELGRRLNCIRHLEGVVFEHLHPDAGKASEDAVYGRSRQWFKHDLAAYKEWLGSEDFRLRLDAAACALGVNP